MRPLLVLSLAVLVLAGCLTPDGAPEAQDAPVAPAAVVEPQDAAPPVPAPAAPVGPTVLLRMGNASAGGSDALRWTGATLDAEGSSEETRAFSLAVPEGAKGRLAVSIRWPLYEDKRFELEVFDASGALVAAGQEGRAALGLGPVPVLPVPGSAAVAFHDAPEPGDYTVLVRATRGAGDYEGSIQFQPDVEATSRELLPNLVTLPPRDLVLEDPFGLPSPPAGPARGCMAGETVERQVVRCLRFSNGIGNLGEGPLEMRLAKEEGPAGLAGQGKFTQRVYRADGSHEDVSAGLATFHPGHAHFHYSGAAAFRVHAHDLESGARGDVLKEGRKTGFCFGDLSLVVMGLPSTAAPRYDASGCLDPLTHDAWVTGLMPNWYDRYHWTWFDQFVDVGDLPDGVYELVSVANEDGSVRETTLADNEASAVFRLAGDKAEVLSTRSSVPAAP